jgi:hypothetical protein
VGGATRENERHPPHLNHPYLPTPFTHSLATPAQSANGKETEVKDRPHLFVDNTGVRKWGKGLCTQDGGSVSIICIY